MTRWGVVIVLLAAAILAGQHYGLVPTSPTTTAPNALQANGASPTPPIQVQMNRPVATPSESISAVVTPSPIPAPANRSSTRLVRLAADGWRALQAGDAQGAIPLFEQAAEGGPSDALFGLALAYQKLGREGEALVMAYQATAEMPSEAGPWRLLGQLLAKTGDLAGAVEAWERALTLLPDPQLERVLETTRNDLATNQRYFVGETRHFRARFEGPAESYLAERVLDMLEAAYSSVGLALGYYPEDVIETILYTKQAFRDVTRTPTWAGGLYDGKVRLPISGADQNPDSLRRVVTHEYTHAAVTAMLDGATIPTWLHEGVALNLEQSRLDGWARRILARQRTALPLSMLSRSFLGLSADQADHAYAQSYVMVKSMIDRFGMYRLADLLNEAGSGPIADAFLRVYGERPEAILARSLTDFPG